MEQVQHNSGAGRTQESAQAAFRPDVVGSVRRHPRLAGGVALTVLALVGGYALTRKPVYEAESLVYVEPLDNKLLADGGQSIYDPTRYASYLQQQVLTVTRAETLEAAIAKMPQGTWQHPEEDAHAAAVRLAAALKVHRVGESFQLAIDLDSGNAQQAAAVVNAVTTTYLEQGRKDENARTDVRLQLLQEERARIQKEMDEAHAEQTQLSEQLGVADPLGAVVNPYDAQLAGMRAELVKARADHDAAAAQLAAVSARSGHGLSTLANDAIANDAGLAALKSTINQRRAQLNSQMAGLTPSNPVYQQDKDELAKLDRDMDARAAQVRETAERQVEDKLRLDLNRTGDVEARLNGQIAQQTAAANHAAPKLQRASELAADLTRLQTRYATVDNAIRGLQLDQSSPGAAHLSTAATVPSAPMPDKSRLLLGLAFPLALLAGVMAAVFASRRDPQVYGAGEVEEALGFAPMATVPRSVYGADGEAAMLRLAAGLERAFRKSNARVFAFTPVSAHGSAYELVEGVAAKLKELGFRVKTTSAEDLLRRDAAGQVAMRLEEYKNAAEMVLIEAAPLVASAEAEYVARVADGTMLVVEGGATTKPELVEVRDLLQRLHVNGVGVVVTESSGGHREGYGGFVPASAPIRSAEPVLTPRLITRDVEPEQRETPSRIRFAARAEEQSVPVIRFAEQEFEEQQEAAAQATNVVAMPVLKVEAVKQEESEAKAMQDSYESLPQVVGDPVRVDRRNPANRLKPFAVERRRVNLFAFADEHAKATVPAAAETVAQVAAQMPAARYEALVTRGMEPVRAEDSKVMSVREQARQAVLTHFEQRAQSSQQRMPVAAVLAAAEPWDGQSERRRMPRAFAPASEPVVRVPLMDAPKPVQRAERERPSLLEQAHAVKSAAVATAAQLSGKYAAYPTGLAKALEVNAVQSAAQPVAPRKPVESVRSEAPAAGRFQMLQRYGQSLRG